MEDSTESTGLKKAAGVLLAIALISAIVFIAAKGIATLNNAGTKMDTTNQHTINMQYMQFNNKDVSGSEVLSAINTKASTKCYIKVTTSDGHVATYTDETNYVGNSPTDAGYVEPTATFKATVHKTANGTVDGLIFQQK